MGDTVKPMNQTMREHDSKFNVGKRASIRRALKKNIMESNGLFPFKGNYSFFFNFIIFQPDSIQKL